MPAECIMVAEELPDTTIILPCRNLIGQEIADIRWQVSSNKIRNVGLSVFNDYHLTSDKETLFFLERIILEMITLPSEMQIDKRLNELDVSAIAATSLRSGDVPLNRKLVYSISRRIDNLVIKRDSINFRVAITNNDAGTLTFDFPADIQLITGMDKPSLDDNLKKTLQNFVFIEELEQASSVAQNSHIVPYMNDLFRISGPSFTSLIIPDLYLRKNVSGYEFVFEKSHPKESLANLMLFPIGQEKMVTLDWKLYGDETNSLSMSLQDFVGYFHKEGFRSYIGFENSVGESIICTVIYFNPNFNYLHLISLNTMASGIFKPDIPIKGKFYTFIPTHNIKNLNKIHEPGIPFHIINY